MAVDMSKHFSLPQLVRYSAPSIAMCLFASIYVIVDGFFVSNFVGKVAFAAVNWTLPFLTILSTVGYMFGTGGTALVAKTRGEGKEELANQYFSMIVFTCLIFGIILSLAGAFAMRPLFEVMGASGEMLDIAVLYGLICLISLPFYMLEDAFQSLFVAAGKPKVGLYVMVAAGVTNMILDALFIGVFGWGVVGAAAATVIGEYIGGLVPIVYFAHKNTSFLRLKWTPIKWHVIGKACSNGLSEMVASIALSLVAMLFNFQLLRLVGEDGVAAFGVVEYVALFFLAVFMGYAMGTGPLMSYQYGAQNRVEMSSIFRKSMLFMMVCGVAMLAIAELTAPLIAWIFTGYDQALCEFTTSSFQIYSISYLFVGIGIYGSSLFTALNNGPISALISFLRTFFLEAGAVLLLPVLFGAQSIWFATPVAEIGAALISVILILAFKNKYGYMLPRKTAAEPQ